MNSHVDCIACIINKANELADKFLIDKKVKYSFLNQVLLEVAHTEEERMAPYVMAKVMGLLSEASGVKDFYEDEKRLFNDKILALEEDIKNLLTDSEDELAYALKLAMSGNVVDFGAFSHVTIEMVHEIMQKTMDSYMDEDTYIQMKKDLSQAKTLLYLADNTGEIVFDKLCIAKIKHAYPHLQVYLATRGKPALNDATEEDAYYVGIDQYATVINNGTDIPGTDLAEVSEAFLCTFREADVIISKGQGNFETLCGSGYNIYYLFLCKCPMMTKKMQVENLSPMFLYEKTMDNPLNY